jgi:leader peptidase (prepilin peptidase)/N-methyltransferase
VTTALAVTAALLGFIAAPLLVLVAGRATDPQRPLLLQGSDLRSDVIFGDGSIRSWAVRLATGLLSAGVVVVAGGGFTTPAYLWLVAITVILTLTDLDTKLIPNRITLRAVIVGVPLLAVGLVLDGNAEQILDATIGALGYGLYLLVIALIVPSGFGFGDVKLAPILGWYIGAQNLSFVIVAVISTHLLSGAVSILLLVTRVKSRKDHIPFGPYMVVGCYVALFAGRAIVDWYIG